MKRTGDLTQRAQSQKAKRGKPVRRAVELPLPAGLRLGLNLILAAVIFFSPAMVMVLGDRISPKETEAWLASTPYRMVEHSRSGLGPALTPLDETTFLRRIETRLPRYRVMFQQEARRNGLPWQLLASQAYQESHWNPRAKSPTGVRGLMQLTKVTSSSLGIRNRLDPAQSIHGGARHLAALLRQLPSQITGPDRLWIALAAYNVGMGHVQDARQLAQRLGKDPKRWADLREVLPLLARKAYYQTLPHRYARGWEPVQYVQRIHAYWNLLHKHDQDPPQPLRSKL